MNHSVKKGKCSNCKVCAAYLREVDRNLSTNATSAYEEKKPALTPLAKKVIKTAERQKQADNGNTGCPADSLPE